MNRQKEIRIKRKKRVVYLCVPGRHKRKAENSESTSRILTLIQKKRLDKSVSLILSVTFRFVLKIRVYKITISVNTTLFITEWSQYVKHSGKVSPAGR